LLAQSITTEPCICPCNLILKSLKSIQWSVIKFKEDDIRSQLYKIKTLNQFFKPPQGHSHITHWQQIKLDNSSKENHKKQKSFSLIWTNKFSINYMIIKTYHRPLRPQIFHGYVNCLIVTNYLCMF
jgi:hypothetical protein